MNISPCLPPVAARRFGFHEGDDSTKSDFLANYFARTLDKASAILYYISMMRITIEETLAQKLKTLRASRGLSLRELKKETGLSDAYLSQLENGKNANPGMRALRTLAKFYNVRIEWLIGE